MNAEIDRLIEEAKGLTRVPYDSPRVDLWERRAKAVVRQHYGADSEEILGNALFWGRMAADEQDAQYMHVEAMSKAIECLEALKNEAPISTSSGPRLGKDALDLLTAAYGNDGIVYRLDSNRGTIIQTGTRPGAKRLVIEDTSRARYALEELERADFLRRESASHYVVTVNGRDFCETQREDNVVVRSATEQEIDAVSGIGLRAYLDSTSRELFQKCRTDGLPCGALVMDADDFKAFNTMYGHAGGDKVLRAVAQTVNDAIRLRGGVVGRWGAGDEIVATMSNLTLAEMEALGERIRRTIEATPVNGMKVTATGAEAGPVAVTVSIGVASSIGFGSVEALWELADQALNEAKQAGKNRVASRGERPEA